MSKNTTKKTKKQILQETYKYYQKNPRGVLSNGEPAYITPEGNMCAIGRCLKNPNKYVGSLNIGFSDVDMEKDLKKEYQGHSEEFWNELQYWHDNGNYWDNKGLNQKGEGQFNLLIEEFNE